MNESQCNFRSIFWHDKVSIVEKGFPDLKNATESLAYKSKLFFAKSLPLNNIFLSFPFETHLGDFFVKHSQEYLCCIFTVVSSYCQAAWKAERSSN